MFACFLFNSQTPPDTERVKSISKSLRPVLEFWVKLVLALRGRELLYNNADVPSIISYVIEWLIHIASYESILYIYIVYWVLG